LLPPALRPEEAVLPLQQRQCEPHSGRTREAGPSFDGAFDGSGVDGSGADGGGGEGGGRADSGGEGGGGEGGDTSGDEACSHSRATFVVEGREQRGGGVRVAAPSRGAASAGCEEARTALSVIEQDLSCVAEQFTQRREADETLRLDIYHQALALLSAPGHVLYDIPAPAQTPAGICRPVARRAPGWPVVPHVGQELPVASGVVIGSIEFVGMEAHGDMMSSLLQQQPMMGPFLTAQAAIHHAEPRVATTRSMLASPADAFPSPTEELRPHWHRVEPAASAFRAFPNSLTVPRRGR